MELFTGKGYISKLLAFFTDIFIPVEIDVLFKHETATTKTAGANQILGYGFIL